MQQACQRLTRRHFTSVTPRTQALLMAPPFESTVYFNLLQLALTQRGLAQPCAG